MYLLFALVCFPINIGCRHILHVRTAGLISCLIKAKLPGQSYKLLPTYIIHLSSFLTSVFVCFLSTSIVHFKQAQYLASQVKDSLQSSVSLHCQEREGSSSSSTGQSHDSSPSDRPDSFSIHFTVCSLSNFSFVEHLYLVPLKCLLKYLC